MTTSDAPRDEHHEWLEADGLGGFASGTATGIRTRRYHAWLLAAAGVPTRRFALVQGCEAWAETDAGRFALTSQRYQPGVVHPDGVTRIERFTAEPWPTWTLRLPGGVRIAHELFVRRGLPLVVASWRRLSGPKPVRLAVRPLFSGRDPHALHHENPAFRFAPEPRDGRLVWRPYEGLPEVAMATNGRYQHAPEWYRRFLYTEERARGLDEDEDLASPGLIHWDLSSGEALCVLAAHDAATAAAMTGAAPVSLVRRLRAAERRRRRGAARLERAADDYLVRRGTGLTVVAGYPWFGDWGRDTFIALRGLCLATGRLEAARSILSAWSGTVSEGMVPNRFADHDDAPEFNSVDASLWFVIAVHESLAAATAAGRPVASRERTRLLDAVEAILAGYTNGTRYGIHLDDDGLLAAGEAGVQLTWMDATVGGRAVTPRIGKPVEVQALWLNALRLSAGASVQRRRQFESGRESFRRRFWDEARGGLYDVVDVDHRPGAVDATVRPNQIFAVGGLPHPLIDGTQARAVTDLVERRLWTPLGLRSLAPDEPGYALRYEGGEVERNQAYHQGTVWPWLAGPFVEAWVRVRGGGREAKQVARTRFLEPLLRHLDGAGVGHLPEIADAEPPHTPRGCPFQAWSVGEALRLDRVVLAEPRGGVSDPPGRTPIDRATAGMASSS
ncbi:MAG: glycogen debranching protein [Candidatus Eisenbacteria bacterium]|uniref:Glycogen debranching protein n=1 Tax=Eiseniibacteriota bacterium TaxID=2212470 RepID=A0A538UAY6_UNCEI|nr:MAG: glycogen debranching protein [Candidatus Eisenbacteria bacterium]